MSIRCLFGHQFLAFSVTHYYDISYSEPPSQGAKSTQLTSRCDRCGKFKLDSLYGAGHLPLQEFQISSPASRQKRIEAERSTRAVMKKLQSQD